MRSPPQSRSPEHPAPATLSGLNNPGGRLPVTFYRGIEQLLLFEDYSMKDRTYRYFSGEPLYPFGYGLSYAHYAYANLKLSKTSLGAGDPLAVDLDVTNRSQRAGDEVVELYLNFPAAPGAPIRALRGFERVHLPAGTTGHVHLDLSSRDLSLVNESGDRVIVPGDYSLTIGCGQPGTGAPSLQTTFTIRGQTNFTRVVFRRLPSRCSEKRLWSFPRIFL